VRHDDTTEVDQLRLKVRDLELALGQNDANLAVTFRLTPVLNNLMGLLLALPNVTPEMIRQRLEIAPDAKVAIHRLRKHIEPWGIEIKSKRNVGYWIESADKLKIKVLVAGIAEQTEAGSVTPQVTSEFSRQVAA
jgi:biotin operon repressor